jgi:hypothetical protein
MPFAMKRRDLLRSAGLVTFFAPFIDLLEPKPVQAATAGFDNVLIFFTNGTDIPAWTPKGSSDTSISFSPMTSPLEAIKENIIIVENLNGNGTTASHGAPGGLTGQGYGPPTQISVEQWISDKLTTKMPIKNALLGSVSTQQQTTFFRAGMAISPIYSATAAYQALFGGFTPMATQSSTPTTAAPDPKNVRRKRQLDQILMNELPALEKSLGASEKAKLELHVDSIKQLEATIDSSSSGGPPPSASCALPTMPKDSSEALTNSATHLDLAIAAFACGRTNVAAVQFGHHQETQVTLPEIGTGDWHNTFCHGEMPPRQHLVNLEKWLCQRFVDAVTKLKAIPLANGSGTLFDRTLVFWARDMGDAVLHTGDNMRYVFAGGGSYFKFSPNGRYVDGKGAPHQNALISVCEAMGVTDYQGFGDQSHPRAPLSGLTA